MSKVSTISLVAFACILATAAQAQTVGSQDSSADASLTRTVNGHQKIKVMGYWMDPANDRSSDEGFQATAAKSDKRVAQ